MRQMELFLSVPRSIELSNLWIFLGDSAPWKFTPSGGNGKLFSETISFAGFDICFHEGFDGGMLPNPEKWVGILHFRYPMNCDFFGRMYGLYLAMKLAGNVSKQPVILFSSYDEIELFVKGQSLTINEKQRQDWPISHLTGFEEIKFQYIGKIHNFKYPTFED